MNWTKLENVIYHIPKDFRYMPNIAIFNFIGTLIKKKNSNDKSNNWEFLYKNILDKLIQLHKNNASIIVYQSFSHCNIEFIKMIFFEFLNKINYTYNQELSGSNESVVPVYKIPIIAFFSIKNNNFNKPCTGLWRMINLLYKKKNKKIDTNKCLMVGNLAGRLDINNNKQDYSVSDRAFAHNIQVKFSTPNNFFNNKLTYSRWQWDKCILSYNEKQHLMNIKESIYVPNILNELPKNTNISYNIVIVTGMPSSGKTTICENLKKLWEERYKSNIYTIDENNNNNNINCNIFSNIYIQEIINDLDNVLKNSYKQKSNSNGVHIDNINNLIIIDIDFNYINIIKIIKIIAKYKLYILLVETNLSKKFNKLLNFINVEKNNKNIIKKHEWNICYSENNKIHKLVNNLTYIKYIKLPIIPIPSKEFWYEYSY